MNEQQPILGIDLGTTYSAVAVIDSFGRPEVLNNTDSEATTPSVVYFESAEATLVGREAKRISKVSPDDTEALVKRAMGETVEFHHHGTTHTPESVSAIILKHLVSEAFIQLQAEPVHPVQAVITVPAYFGAKEKEATKTAALMAGIDLLALVAEPVAAALAYGARYGSEPKTIFVYDLGGGTFDTTILTVRPDQLEVVVIDGHRRLGGADWDEVLIGWALGEFITQAAPQANPQADEQFMQNLALEIEEAKKSLSRRTSVNIALSFAGASLKLELTRDKLEELTAALVEATIEVVNRTMATAQQKVPGLVVDEVLLVGGSSKMSLVARRLEETLGRTPVLADPDLAVAKGAAVYTTIAALAAEHDVTGGARPDTASIPVLRGTSAHVVNVLPRGFGIATYNDSIVPPLDEVDWLVAANTRLPVDTIVKPYRLSHDNTTSLNIRLFEQNTEVPSIQLIDNTEVTPEAGAEIRGLPRLPKGSPIEVRIDINHEGLATISAFEPVTGQRLDIPVQFAGLAQEQIQELTEVVSRLTTR